MRKRMNGRLLAAAVAAGTSTIAAKSDPPGGGDMPGACPPGVSCGTPKFGDCSIFPPGAPGCGETVTVCETMFGPPSNSETDCGKCFTGVPAKRKQTCWRYANVASIDCDAEAPGLTVLPCTDSEGACCASLDPFPQNAAGPKYIFVPAGFTCCGGIAEQ